MRVIRLNRSREENTRTLQWKSSLSFNLGKISFDIFFPILLLLFCESGMNARISRSEYRNMNQTRRLWEACQCLPTLHFCLLLCNIDDCYILL